MIDLDGGPSTQDVADDLHANHRAIVGREAHELGLVAAWLDAHNKDSLPTRLRGRALPGMERAKLYGGDGTPLVAEFAIAELAALLEISPRSAANLAGDALDLRHRHPRLWARVRAAAQTGPDGCDAAETSGPATVRVWQARKIAQACHAAALDLEQARWVDEVTTPLVGVQPWGRFFDKTLPAAIIEVDPGAAEARAKAAAMSRFVSRGRSNEHGLKTMVIKATAGDATALFATIDRLAQILALEGDTDPVDVRRSKAAGILANPHRALLLLLKYAAGSSGPSSDNPSGAGSANATTDLETLKHRKVHHREPVHAPDDDPLADLPLDEPTADEPPPDPADEPPPDPLDEPPTDRLDPLDLHPFQDDADEPCPACRGSGHAPPGDTGPPPEAALGAALLDAIRTGKLDAGKLLPAATLYVHVSGHALHHAAHGCSALDAGGAGCPECPHCAAGEGLPSVARVDGIGPALLDEARVWLRHRRVDLKPVIDLADDRSVDGYEVPDWMSEAQRLRHPGSAAPYSNSLATNMDDDHTIAYSWNADGSPAEPGQTRPGNLGRLERFMHRVKTFGRGWRHYQPRPGVYLWRTPHGYWFLVDHQGTHPLGKDPDLSEYARTDPEHTEEPPAA